MPKKILAIVALTILLLLAVALPSFASPAKPGIIVYYYYFNACSSCDEEGSFYEQFNALVGKAKEGIELQIICYNTFHPAAQEDFLDACEKHNIPKDKRVPPIVFISDAALIGRKEIDSRLASAFAQEKQKALQQAAADDSMASRPVYFYVSPCDDCAAVKQFLDGLPSAFTININGKPIQSHFYPDAYNVAEPKNLELVKKYFLSYKVPEGEQEVPIIFLKDGYLSGRDEIISGLEAAINNGRCIGITSPSGEVKLQPYEWPGIFLTGIINGFNPCSISMLLFLVTLLLARKANVLKLGSLFILGKFVAYLALGTLLFDMLSAIDNHVLKLFTDIVKYILLAVVIIVAVVNFNDFLASKNERYNKIRMQLPVGLRKQNHKWLKGIDHTKGWVLLLLVFALGIAISVGEFLCTGQIYLATILYLLKRSQELDLQTMGAFLVYVIGMLSPLVVITLSLHKGCEVFDVSEMVRKNMPVIKLINAIVFIVFAVLILLFF